MNRYKIRLIKTWDFELDGNSKDEVERTVFEMMNYTKILDLPETKKRLRLKIKQIKERKLDNEEDN